MKATKFILATLTVLGAGLVSQGLITGEQLTSIQSILGFVLGGGGITALGIIGILGAIPKEIVKSAFDKATEKYGEESVNGFLDNIEVIISTVKTLTDKVYRLDAKIDAQDERTNNLLG